MKKIDEKTVFTEVYHSLMLAAEEFGRISANVPRSLIEVTQHMHGRFDSAAFSIMRASNTFDLRLKNEELQNARICIFFQYSSIEYLVKTRGASIKRMNKLIEQLSDVYNQLGKWQRSIVSEMSKEDRLQG